MTIATTNLHPRDAVLMDYYGSHDGTNRWPWWRVELDGTMTAGVANSEAEARRCAGLPIIIPDASISTPPRRPCRGQSDNTARTQIRFVPVPKDTDTP